MSGGSCFLLAVDGDFKYFPSYEDLKNFLAEQAQQEQQRQGGVLQGHIKDSSAKKKQLRVFADSLSWYVLLFGQTQSLLELKISGFIAELKNIYDEKYQLLRDNLEFECEQHNQQSGDKKTVESYIADFIEWAKKELGKEQALCKIQLMCAQFQLIDWRGCQPGQPIQFFVFGQAFALIDKVSNLSQEITKITVVGNAETSESMQRLCWRLDSSNINGVAGRKFVFNLDVSYQPEHSVHSVQQQPQAMSLTERCVQARNDTFDIRVGDNGFKRLLHGYLGFVRPSDPWPVLLLDGLFSIALVKPVLGLVKGLVVMPLSLVVRSLEHADASVKQNPRLSTVSKGILRGLIHFALVFVQPLSFLLTFILSPLASLQRLYHDPIDESQRGVCQTDKVSADSCASPARAAIQSSMVFASPVVVDPLLLPSPSASKSNSFTVSDAVSQAQRNARRSTGSVAGHRSAIFHSNLASGRPFNTQYYFVDNRKKRFLGCG